MKVIIIGAGIGGLACAVACRREGIEVEVLEKAPKILPIGAGIQVPPNGARACRSINILDKVSTEATVLESILVRRYSDSHLLQTRQLGRECTEKYGAPWLVLHRATYVGALIEEATAAGARIQLGTEVVDVDFDAPHVVVAGGAILKADVIVGADGLWSVTRDKLLGTPSPPIETGDLAYRATFTKEALLALGDSTVAQLCAGKTVNIWLGPDKHAVFYSIRNGEQFNLVLIRPDNLPASTRTERGDVDEMRLTFEGWDDVLTKIISCVPSVLKWKLYHHDELESWQRGKVVLLGDACHPTLPYQAQGAAMAVEDATVLGRLLGLFQSLPKHFRELSHLLKLYEKLRKTRTTANVRGAVNNRTLFHMRPGPEQTRRDAELTTAKYDKPSELTWLDPQYNMDLLGFDAVTDCEEAFKAWVLK